MSEKILLMTPDNCTQALSAAPLQTTSLTRCRDSKISSLRCCFKIIFVRHTCLVSNFIYVIVFMFSRERSAMRIRVPVGALPKRLKGTYLRVSYANEHLGQLRGQLR
jgi:hypothetical protein